MKAVAACRAQGCQLPDRCCRPSLAVHTSAEPADGFRTHGVAPISGLLCVRSGPRLQSAPPHNPRRTAGAGTTPSNHGELLPARQPCRALLPTRTNSAHPIRCPCWPAHGFAVTGRVVQVGEHAPSAAARAWGQWSPCIASQPMRRQGVPPSSRSQRPLPPGAHPPLPPHPTPLQLPIITRYYVTLAFLTTAGCALEVRPAPGSRAVSRGLHRQAGWHSSSSAASRAAPTRSTARVRAQGQL
jgi:hypothetical protein